MCGSDGRVLARTTWYTHNPGGKKAKILPLTQGQVDLILSQPAPKWGNRRKRTFEEAQAEELLRLSKQATGSSSVRLKSDRGIICTVILMKIYTQSARIDAEAVNRHETTPETPYSRPITPSDPDLDPDPDPEIHRPSTPPDREDNGRIQEFHSPSPPANNLIEEEVPGPAPGPIINNLGQDNFRHDDFDQDHTYLGGLDGHLLDEFNRDNTHLGGFEEPPLFDDSDEEDTPLVQPRDDEDEGDTPPASDDEDDPHITLEHMKTNLQFIGMVEDTTLESQFSAAELRAFRNPEELRASPSNDPDLKLSISFYISSLDHASSERAYAASRRNILTRYPNSNMLSYDQVKRRVSNLSGLTTWKNHMCVDSCAAFTGPYAAMDECPRCHKPRYDQDKLKKSNGKDKVPQKEFSTFALGPQLQARWRSPEMAQKMFYRRNKTQDELNCERGADYVYDDVFCGSDYLDAVERGEIGDYDTVVMLSIDGAQLYRNKKSDCWIYIWIVLDLAPDKRYKIRNIIPGGVIPGPEKPKHLDSFLFPGLAHVSAIQKEGLHLWDGYNRMAAISLIFVLLALADAVGMAEVSGSVGHHGRKGCRLLCELIGRNKPKGSHYYPALLRPDGVRHATCTHPDINIENLPPVDPEKYRDNLNHVLTSPSEVVYRQRRLETGIRKASIFDGLRRILSPPTCFPGDIMHQPVINLTALMFELWCDQPGESCRKGDPDGVWPWAVLTGDIWKAHGKAVADAAQYFPRSFDRTPRNPAEKLSSGYKAWELLLYFYGLGPGLFYGILPEPYYQHYCKLVVAIRIVYQREITHQQLKLANKYLLKWVIEFECLYYQRKLERLHFVRQCVHSLTHLAPETHRLGPPSLSAQWTMERVIGILGSLIKQPSNPFANLAEQAKKVAEINTITTMWPDLEHSKHDPRGSIDIGQGFLLLGPRDSKPYPLSPAERTALAIFYSSLPDVESVLPQSVYRWGRLQIPTEQTARSHWKEVVRTSNAA